MRPLRAKKSLGQNFLKSKLALRKIVEAGEITPVRAREGSQGPSASNGVKNQELVLEIGPGRGALTEKLLEAGARVIAVEKDNGLYELLKIKFAKAISSGQLNLINSDILEFNTRTYNLETRTYKIIANIPYNITGAIFKKFLTAEYQPTSMVVMVQHEVAKRIVAGDGKESLLSISVKAYGEPKMVMKVPARDFSPAPKVDSAVISIKNISRKNFTSPPAPLLDKERVAKKPGEVEQRFWEVVRAGFAHKRKRLAGNLKGMVSGEVLTTLGNKRAEELTLSDWLKICSI